MLTVQQSSLQGQAEEGIVCTIATNYRETGALGLSQIHTVTFEQWLALYALGELDRDMELQDMAACHMEMAAEHPAHGRIAAQTRARIAERRMTK